MYLVVSLSIALGIAAVPFLETKVNAVTILVAELVLIACFITGRIDGSALLVYSLTMVLVSQVAYFVCLLLLSMVAYGRIRRGPSESHEYDF